MKRKSYTDSPRSPPRLSLEWGEDEDDYRGPAARFEIGNQIEMRVGNLDEKTDAVLDGKVEGLQRNNTNGDMQFGQNVMATEMELECKEEMPVFSPKVPDHNTSSNIKRRRVLPPFFLSPPLPSVPEDSSSDTESFIGDRETLCRMRMAAQIVFGDIEDREAERLRENGDYLEGDTPQTSQESKLSDYNWSTREGGDTVPLDEIMQFIWKYLARPRIYTRVAIFAHLSEELFERDPDRVKGMVADILNCEPVVLLNTLEDAIEVAENIFQADGESDSEVEREVESALESVVGSAARSAARAAQSAGSDGSAGSAPGPA